MSTLRTARLLLRPWTEADREPFAVMNADPAVMEHFPSLMSRAESDAFVDRVQAQWAERGFGLFAVEDPSGFIGFVGLLVPRFELPLAHLADPPVEIGWRLARSAWGHGYATEGARAVLGQAFGDLELPEVLSFTTVGNLRSRAVMERIGMHHDPGDVFDHPLLAEGSPIRRHVLYRITSEEFARLGA